ncbi:MAG: penicillin acylase family protein [Armatimonadota bacterium]|nr:penicillin acylase family protein [Armatimonadota bacterium]MDR7452714.1 penicillin acylase family protein [Armatimonadota bacterium]MDR7465731.1 penicillin acylase family protein [Armatimonadota bacterium]MDR7493639.1 penicillin acylase family protein [Armatimonadota bacterium]MDR7499112.1 penicillin acylase family protein [Armatimonadota bacterium]
MRRLLAWLLAVVLLAVVVAGGAGTYLIIRAFPRTEGLLAVPGLEEPVEVLRDRWGVPHLVARNAYDLFFAQGFVHAQDRLWQMEFNRRVASGRLSEIFGATTLSTDRFLRTVGLRRAAEAEWPIQDEEARAAARAYADGVNAFLRLAGSRLPVEFTLLRFRPDPWTPVDSLAFAKLMAWVLSGNWESEILRAHLAARFGPDGMRALMPPYPANHPVIVPRTDFADFRSPAVLRLLEAAPSRRGVGSNNWVVSSARTDTGAPLLANDPHLEAGMPSIWYEMHLQGGGFNVIGATFPGTPGVVIGHNEHIAWGVTNAGPDVQDLYIERFHPADPTRYLFRGRWERAAVVEERIVVRGRREPEVLTVRITRHGPVLNAVVEGLPSFLALRWTALTPGKILSSLGRLNRARNWREFREALRDWTVPAQNFVYADREGNIGYQLPGRIPLRARGDGLLPVPGWTGEYEWVGEIPFDRLPSWFNPERGYLVTANNRIVPPSYRYLLGLEWDPGFRAQRIEAMLREKPRLGLPDFQRIQNDLLSLPGQAMVRALGTVRVTTEPGAWMLAELRGWDGVLSPDSRAAAIYEAVRVTLPRLLFADVLGPDLFKRYLDRSDAWMLAVTRLLNDPASPWWAPRGRDAVVVQALEEAYDILRHRLGSDRTTWTWGRLHVMRFEHPMGRVRALSWIFNATAPPTGGDLYTVNNGGFDATTFRQVVVASYRQIVDLADFDRSVAIHTTGQSGLPFHRHYKDFVPLWARGQYHPLVFSRTRIEAEVAGRLTLRPP